MLICPQFRIQIVDILLTQACASNGLCGDCTQTSPDTSKQIVSFCNGTMSFTDACTQWRTGASEVRFQCSARCISHCLAIKNPALAFFLKIDTQLKRAYRLCEPLLTKLDPELDYSLMLRVRASFQQFVSTQQLVEVVAVEVELVKVTCFRNGEVGVIMIAVVIARE
jgi:hypothetical protein